MTNIKAYLRHKPAIFPSHPFCLFAREERVASPFAAELARLQTPCSVPLCPIPISAIVKGLAWSWIMDHGGGEEHVMTCICWRGGARCNVEG